MTTIHIEAEISTEQLLHAVEQLPPQEFASFVAHLLAVRARRQERALSPDETALLLQINRRLSPDRQRRFDDLVAKRQAETITHEELEELILLTEMVEQHDSERLQALDTLARLRQVALSTLMTDLGITHSAVCLSSASRLRCGNRSSSARADAANTAAARRRMPRSHSPWNTSYRERVAGPPVWTTWLWPARAVTTTSMTRWMRETP